jgi:NAD-dependent dihydropyrimidine dehydrogenase PreA subunit
MEATLEESIRKVDHMPKVTIDHDICTFCQTCVNTCPMGVFEVEDDRVVPSQEDQCIVCRACEASCPVEAITVEE